MYNWLVLISIPDEYREEFEKLNRDNDGRILGRLQFIAHENNGISYIDVDDSASIRRLFAERTSFEVAYDYYFNSFDDGEAAQRDMYEFLQSFGLHGTTIYFGFWRELTRSYQMEFGAYEVGVEGFEDDVSILPYFPEPDIELE